MKRGIWRRVGATLFFLLLCSSLVWGAEDGKTKTPSAEKAETGSKTTSTGRYYALIIGDNNYKYPLSKLKTAVNDAEAVGKILREQYGFITEILINATRSDIFEALTRKKDPQFADQSLLIYYAGHGEYDDKVDKAYWLPVDAQKGRKTNWISSDDITAGIRGLPFRHVLIVSDSCYSGGMLWEGKAKYYDESRRADYLNDMIKNPSRTLMASGSKDEPVADSGYGKHSVFAAVLIKALSEIKETTFTAEELFGRGGVQEGVVGKSKQTPYYSFLQNSGHERGDFVFTRVIKEESAQDGEKTGSIIVKSGAQRAKVYIEGEFSGETPLTIGHVKPGSYEIKVKKIGFHEYIKRVGVEEGQEVEVYAGLEQMPAMSEITEPVTGMRFIFVEGGTFKMGDMSGEGFKDERPLHEVRLDDFYMGRYEVTQGQWRTIMGDNPSAFKMGDDYPVENVRWNDVQEFIAGLNRRSGGSRYRLPTEAEWEYAARSRGKEEKYAGFSAEGELHQYGNFCDLNCEFDWKETGQNDGYAHTAPVGGYAPNGLGLYDMTGNVWEWVSDAYYEFAYNVYGRAGTSSNPLYEGSGVNRVVRGGSWSSPLQARDLPDERARQDLRTSCRNGYRKPSNRYNDVGFRLVLISESIGSLPFYLWPARQMPSSGFSADCDMSTYLNSTCFNQIYADRQYSVGNFQREVP